MKLFLNFFLFNMIRTIFFLVCKHFKMRLFISGGKSCVYPTKRPLTPRDLTARNAIVIQQPANDSSQLTQVIAVDYPIICK